MSFESGTRVWATAATRTGSRGVGPLVMNGSLSASANERRSKQGALRIVDRGVDQAQFRLSRPEISGEFECALKIGEMSGVF
jgi:hypothetical protein